MSTLRTWLEMYRQKIAENGWHFCLTKAEMQGMEDLIDENISARDAARAYTQSLVKAKEPSLEKHLEVLLSAAVENFDPNVQEKIVMLLSAIRHLQYAPQTGHMWKYLAFLGKSCPTKDMFPGFKKHIADWSASLESRIESSLDMSKHQYSLFINITAFRARLTTANLCDYAPEAIDRCESFLSQLKQGKAQLPSLFSVSLAIAAQYMIYAGFEVYELCKKRNQQFRWYLWKEAFITCYHKISHFFITTEAKGFAMSAIQAMDRVGSILISNKEVAQQSANRRAREMCGEDEITPYLFDESKEDNFIAPTVAPAYLFDEFMDDYMVLTRERYSADIYVSTEWTFPGPDSRTVPQKSNNVPSSKAPNPGILSRTVEVLLPRVLDVVWPGLEMFEAWITRPSRRWGGWI